MENKINVTPGYGQKLRPPVLPGSKINLPLVDQFRGKTVFLFFHRGASDSEGQLMIDNLGKLQRASSNLLREDVQIIAISTDQIKTEDENKNKENILLVSDRTGYTSKRFGVLDTEKHESLMSLFVLGPDGVVKGTRVWGEALVPTLEELETILTQFTGFGRQEEKRENMSTGEEGAENDIESVLQDLTSCYLGTPNSSSEAEDDAEYLKKPVMEIKDDRSLDIKDFKNQHVAIKEERNLDQDEEWPVPRLTQIVSSLKGLNGTSKGSNISSKESNDTSKGSCCKSDKIINDIFKGSNNSSKGGNDSFKESKDSSKRSDNSSKVSKNALKGVKNIKEEHYSVLNAIEEAGELKSIETNVDDNLNKGQDLNTDILKGMWKRTSSEQYEEFLDALDVNFILRKAATMSTPVMEITEEEGVWSIKTSTALKSMELKFKLGEEFEETTPDGRDVKAIVTLEGNKLISVQKAKKAGQQSTRVVREFNGDECVQTSTVDGKKLVCVQKFERMV